MSISRRILAPLLSLVVSGSASWAQGDGTLSAVPIPARLKVFDPSYIDKSVSACQDFFSFANGDWIKHDTIPAAFSTSGVAKEMTDRNELIVRSVLEEAMAAPRMKPATSTVAKLGRFYSSCMDSARAEREGVSAVKADLATINGVTTRQQLVREIATLQRNGINVLFNFFPQCRSQGRGALHRLDNAGWVRNA